MWTVVLSMCASVSLIMALALCLCWRKKAPKNELLGLDGMVTQKNPDENVNHLPSAAPFDIDGTNVNADVTEINDSNKSSRNVPVSNTRRSLPDIPSEQGAVPVNWEPNCDNSSEHYATVGQYQNGKRSALPNGIEARPSISQHSSISQADDAFSPYEKVKYDKIKAKEHPYAQLQPTTSRQAAIDENKLEERISLLRPDGSTTSSEPSAPPRSRRSSAHSSIGIDIPAASAVSGGIAASPDLPYMTPPVAQPNFSGDSQDSSKGYTRISVREPISLIPQRTEINKKLEQDQHYSTVSDDSDDVYTTIPDPNNQIYTSESETYARIPPHPITVEAEVNPTPSRLLDEIDVFYGAVPQPLPGVGSLKQPSNYSHSRQASSSSSIANIGSPKPEKRQANSPLPPPPTGSCFEFPLEKRNLDDLYAKVNKNKKKEDSDGDKTPEQIQKSLDSVSGKSVSICSLDDNKQSPIPEKKLDPITRRREHNYETLRNDCNDPDYERIPQDEPGYASINGPESITSSDPGYEVLKRQPHLEADPNYEELRRHSSNGSDCAGYSKINYAMKLNKSEEKSSSYSNSIDEPNYESMPSESLSSDHNYAAFKSTGSESDPNYESVKDLEEPSYERLNDSKADSDKSSRRGYEDVDTSESSNGEVVKIGPPYEQLNDTDSEVPGYERIERAPEDANGSSVDSTSSGKSEKPPNGLLEEDGVFQV